MNNLTKQQHLIADKDIDLAFTEFERRGEISDNAENLLFAAELYQTQCKVLTQQNAELIKTLELVLDAACEPYSCSEDTCDMVIELLQKCKEN